MENLSNKDIFGLQVDEQARAHFLETARWGKFLGIVGYIMCVLILLMGIGAAAGMSLLGGDSTMMAGLGVVYAVVFIAMGLLYFFPAHYLYKSSVGLKSALNHSNQQEFNDAVSYQRRMFKFMGILMIIFLAFYGLMIIFGIFGAMMAGM